MDEGDDVPGFEESEQINTKPPPEHKTIWCKAISASVVCVLIALFSFMSVNLIALSLQWMFEGRRFYSVRQVHRAIFDYYKNKFYLWYLMIRNWDCHEDGKIKVVMPNYLAS